MSSFIDFKNALDTTKKKTGLSGYELSYIFGYKDQASLIELIKYAKRKDVFPKSIARAFHAVNYIYNLGIKIPNFTDIKKTKYKVYFDGFLICEMEKYSIQSVKEAIERKYTNEYIQVNDFHIQKIGE